MQPRNHAAPDASDGGERTILLGGGGDHESSPDVYGARLFRQHAEMLRASGITPEHARRRGYVSVDTKARLEHLGFSPAQRRVPGLLVPLRATNGAPAGWQYRPDDPRQRGGKGVKYESPTGQRNRIDVPPGAGPALGDPTVPLFITEGSKKADAAYLAGLTCVSLAGVWGWRGTNEHSGKTALADWHDIALGERHVVIAFDSDVMRNASVHKAMRALADYLATKGAGVKFLHLPDDGSAKTGLDDFLAAGHSRDDVMALVSPHLPAPISLAPPTDQTRETMIDPPRVSSSPFRKHRRLAERFAAEHRDKLLHVVGLGWHYWDGHRWARDEGDVRARRAVASTVKRAWAEAAAMDDGERRAEFRADITTCETAQGTKGVLELAAVIEGMTATVAEMDADPFLLNTAGGTLDLRTGEIPPARPSDRITKITRGAYRPGQGRPVFDAFLARVLPSEDVRAFMQRLFGSSLLGLVRDHVLAILTGAGANGKTTLVEAVGRALGDYYLAAPPTLLTEGKHQAHPTETMTLLGRRLVTLTETDKGAAMSVERMKRLTGGDRISARLLYRDFVEFTPSHTPVMITNHLPQVPGDDPAVWRRLLVVPFLVIIPDGERDTQLPERLELEADGILTWIIDGYTEYVRDDRGLDPPAEVKAKTEQYRKDSDLVALFLTDVCTVEPFNDGYHAAQARIWEAWQVWCRNNNAAAGQQKDLVDALTATPGISRRKIMTGQMFYGVAVS